MKGVKLRVLIAKTAVRSLVSSALCSALALTLVACGGQSASTGVTPLDTSAGHAAGHVRQIQCAGTTLDPDGSGTQVPIKGDPSGDPCPTNPDPGGGAAGVGNTNPPPGDTGGAGSGGAQTVAVYSSPPTDGEKCNASGFGYHDNLGTFAAGLAKWATNINEIWAGGASFPFAAANGQLLQTAVLAGWMYVDQSGNIYYQGNPSSGISPSFSVGVNAGVVSFSLTGSLSSNSSAQPLKKADGSSVTSISTLGPGLQDAPCWSSLGTIIPKLTLSS